MITTQPQAIAQSGITQHGTSQSDTTQSGLMKPSQPEQLATRYLSLKTGVAYKTGPRSDGQIHYRVLTDSEHQHLYFTITGNDGGGYYSKEIIPLSNIEHCLAGLPIGAEISAKVFANAFVGKSSNNSGFLAAILRAERLFPPPSINMP